MSELIHLDSCDHYDSTTSVQKWVSAVTVISGGRTGKGVQNGLKRFNLEQTVAAGAACKLSNLSQNIFIFGNPRSNVQAILACMSDSRFYVRFMPYGSPVGWVDSASSLVTTVRANQWFYLEFKCYHSSTVLSNPARSRNVLTFTVRVNEEIILSDTITVDLGWPYEKALESGFTEWACVWYGHATVYDDIYITDGEFLGDIKIYVIRPNGVGDENDWDVTGAPTNWEATDDIVPDGNTTYISTEDVEAISMVDLEDISLSGAIKGIQVNSIATKDDAGSCSFKQHSKVSGEYYENADDIYPSYNSWLDHTCPHRKNPITESDFTVEEINAMQIGIRRTS